MEKAVGCLMDDEEGSGTFLCVGATPLSETVFGTDATPSRVLSRRPRRFFASYIQRYFVLT